MVDNVTIPATGTGSTTPVVATDDVGGFHYQRLKLADGADGSSTMLDVVAEDEASAGAETGIIAMARRTDTPGNQSGTDGDWEALQMSAGGMWVKPLRIIKALQTDVTRPADTAVYAAGDALSDSTTAPTSGGFTFSNAARVSGGGGIILGALLATSNDVATRLSGEIWIFNTSVTNINDNAAFAVSDTEIKTCIGVIPFTFFDSGNNGFSMVPNLSIPYVCSGSANLRFLYRVRNAYTPASAEVITATIYVEQMD